MFQFTLKSALALSACLFALVRCADASIVTEFRASSISVSAGGGEGDLCAETPTEGRKRDAGRGFSSLGQGLPQDSTGSPVSPNGPLDAGSAAAIGTCNGMVPLLTTLGWRLVCDSSGSLTCPFLDGLLRPPRCSCA